MNEESRILRHLIKMSNNSKINKHTGKKCRSRRTIKGLKRERRRRKEITRDFRVRERQRMTETQSGKKDKRAREMDT